MKLVQAILLGCALAACSHQGVYGTYRNCAMTCEEIDLRRDGTFTYRVWGDLIGDTSDTGKWRFEGSDNRIIRAEGSFQERLATSRPLPPAGERLAIRVVLDGSGTPLPGSQVVISCPTMLEAQLTDQSGVAEFTRCGVTHVEVASPGSKSFDQDLTLSGDLEVLLPLKTVHAQVGSGSWFVSGGRLYRLGAQPLPRAKAPVRE